MSENKTVKYHIPEQGIYLYARTSEGKAEMIVLTSTEIDFTENLTLSARQSLVIEF